MLIDFAVRNFRSIKNEVLLSAVAQRSRATTTKRKGIRSDEEIANVVAVDKRNFSLLPVVGILGPNASGKSTVLNALDSVLSFIKFGSRGKKGLEPFVPFRLDSKCAEEPSSFKLNFVLEGNMFEYILAVSQERIHEEVLSYLPTNGRYVRLLYRAKWNSEKEIYEWENSENSGLPRKHLAFREFWIGSEPFLHTFVDTFRVEPIEKLASWLRTCWPGVGIGEHADIDLLLSTGFMGRSPDLLKDIAEMMRRLDVNVDEVELSQDKNLSGIRQLVAVHNTVDGAVKWGFENESVGTQALFPLLTK